MSSRRLSYSFHALLFWVVLVAASLAQEPQEEWRALFQRGQVAFSAMKADEAISLMTSALKLTPSNDSTLNERIKMYQIRSSSLELRGRVKEALEDSMSALNLFKEQTKGQESPSWLRPLIRVAKLLDQTQDRKSALGLYELGLSIVRKQPKELQNEEIEILYLKARTQRRMSDWSGARETTIAYIAGVERKMGKDHPDLVGPLKDLAHYQRNCQDFQGAIDTLNRWVAIYESVKGKSSPTTATGLKAIAQCRIALRQFEKAEADCNRWQAVLERVTKKHPEIITVLETRAKIDRLQEKFDEETAHLVEACERMRALPKPDLVKLGDLYRLKATSLRMQNQLKPASEAINESLALFKKKLRPTDPQRLVARMERADIAFHSDKMVDAKKEYDAVLKIWRKIAGDEHNVLLPPLRGLLAVAKKTNDQVATKKLDTWIKKINASK